MTSLPPVVILVAKAFQRPDIPRAKQEAEALMDAGYSVHVLAWDRYGEFPRREIVDGIIVHSFSPVNLTKFSRLALALGGLLIQPILLIEAIKLVRILKTRPIIHAHDVNTLLVGTVLKSLHLCYGLVYDCREFTFGVYYEWYNLLIACIVRVLEEKCLRIADTIITVSDPIRDYLCTFNESIEVIYNCPSTGQIPRISKGDARTYLGLPVDAFIVSCVGTLRYDLQMDLLLSVASLTKTSNIRYVVVGEGPLAARFSDSAAKIRGIRLTIRPRVSREKALAYVSASDLTWAVYQNKAESFNPRMTVPWKFFESLACGVPVIVEAGTFRAELVKKLKCGVVLESDRPQHVSQIILSLSKHPEQLHILATHAKSAAVRTFNWEAMSARLVDVYRRLRRPARSKQSFARQSGQAG